jgi:hypothetical protein
MHVKNLQAALISHPKENTEKETNKRPKNHHQLALRFY